MLRIHLSALASGLLRRTWIVAIAAVLVCSAFAAHAASSIVEAQAFSPPAVSPPVTRATPPAAPPRAPRDGADLVARNMFCSTCDPPPADPGNPGAVYSGKPAILIATAIGKESRATVRVPETEVQGDWGLGDRVPGVGTIDRIGPVSIDVVDSAGVHATLRLLALPATDPNGSAKPSKDPSPPDPYADSIKKIDDKTYEVRRELVRELVTGVQKPGKIRMMPIVNKDGEVGGVRVYGVTPGSLPNMIGLKSADTIDSINGEPIKSAQQLLDLYAKLDKLDTVELGGKRAGKPLAIELRLR